MMAKVVLVQTLFLTFCWFAFVSGKIENEDELKAFIKNKVIGVFRPWARTRGKEQFAVMMLMDTDEDWNTFKFSLAPSKTYPSIVQPKEKSNMLNYVAVIPGKINSNDNFLHSEQRSYNNYLKDMLSNYKAAMNRAPKAMVLYSWAVPCYQQLCPSTGTTGCTSHTIKALKNYTKEMKVIIAYTTLGGGMSGNTKCNASKTTTELEAKGIDVTRINGNFNNKEAEQEAMIESLIKLVRLEQILE